MLFIGITVTNGTHLLFRESQQRQIDDHLVGFAATVVESKLSIDSVAVSLYAFPFAIAKRKVIVRRIIRFRNL